MQKQGPDDWIILHGKDATAYLLTGALSGRLKQIAMEKGAKNIVTLEGTPTGTNTAACERTNNVTLNDAGKQEIASDVRCIKYYYFNVSAIVSVADSEEELPALRRDKEMESGSMQQASTQGIVRSEIIGEIYGTIKACNLRAAVKTVEIRNEDRKSPLRSLTVMLSSDTRIARRIGKAAPEPLLPQNLRPGQRVTVMYSRNEVRAKALTITVTKE